MSEICNGKENKCGGRREFLVSAGLVAGGLVLSLSNAELISAKTTSHVDETVIKLDENSPLNKVGGSQLVDTAAGKVIVARTGETTFAAVSAVCSHKGATLGFDDLTKQFACPSHGSRFNTDGTVAKGPAKNPVRSVKPQSAIILAGE